MKLGIMQGRLSPRLSIEKYQYFPTDTWKREFEIAKSLGFDYIELVHDYNFDQLNPEELKGVIEMTGVKASHLCYDSFNLKTAIAEPNSFSNLLVMELEHLFRVGKIWGLEYITIPIIESEALQRIYQVDEFITTLNHISWSAAKNNIEICLELDLNRTLLDVLFSKIRQKVYPSINIGMTLDTGNHYYNKLGPKDLENVKHVHIKDRLLNGQSCILGSGQTNFEEILEALPNLKKTTLNYTLQCSRSEIFNSEFAEITNITYQFQLMKEILGV